MSSLGAITLNGFREALRNRVTLVVLMFAFIMIFSSTVALELTVATFERVMTDLGLGMMGIITAFLTIFLASGLVPKEIERRTIYMVLAKPVSRSSFIVGRFFGNVLTVYFVTLIMAILFIGQLLAQGIMPHMIHWVSIVGLCLQTLVLSAVAFALASFASQFMTAIASVCLYSIGHLTPDLYSMADRSKSDTMMWIGKGLYYLLPNLDRLAFASRATYNDPVSWNELFFSCGYAIAYSALMLVVASILFERRDFK
jgi:Cu-processing system permease protein